MLGIGIDEDTAIIVEHGVFKVHGRGGVYVVDGSGLTHSNIAEAQLERTLSIYDVRLHVLSAGNTFFLTDRRPGAAGDVRDSNRLAVVAGGDSAQRQDHRRRAKWLAGVHTGPEREPRGHSRSQGWACNLK